MHESTFGFAVIGYLSYFLSIFEFSPANLGESHPNPRMKSSQISRQVHRLIHIGIVFVPTKDWCSEQDAVAEPFFCRAAGAEALGINQID